MDADAARQAAEGNASTGPPADSDDAPASFEETCLRMLEQTAARQSELIQETANLSSQSAFQRQQFAQLYDAVRQLYDAVSLQCRQLLQSDQAMQQELQRFQTGGPQRAMASVFHKLFRDLVAHVGEMDDLLGQADGQEPGEMGSAWIRSVRVLRDRFEALLKDWGATPIPVEIGKEEFNPEIHEAVAAEPEQRSADLPEHVILRVRRRGWTLHGQVILPPLVVVN
jgi:molecular chaperone GrpE (heat shock protein)